MQNSNQVSREDLVLANEELATENVTLKMHITGMFAAINNYRAGGTCPKLNPGTTDSMRKAWLEGYDEASRCLGHSYAPGISAGDVQSTLVGDVLSQYSKG